MVLSKVFEQEAYYMIIKEIQNRNNHPTTYPLIFKKEEAVLTRPNFLYHF